MSLHQVSKKPSFQETDWVPLQLPGCFSIGIGQEMTWVRRFNVPECPTWVQLGQYGKELWDHIAGIRHNTFATQETGARIVATMCYPNDHSEGYTIFQSTIPRGPWRRRIQGERQKKRAERTAPRWCRAAYAPGSVGGDTNVEIHAEDGAAFLCERAKRTTMGWFELSRMVPYGQGEETGGTAAVLGSFVVHPFDRRSGDWHQDVLPLDHHPATRLLAAMSANRDHTG